MDTIKIEKINQISDLIWDQKYETGIKRHRSPYLYRGLSNSAFNLATTLQRNCKEKKDIMEPVILRNFTKYATIEDPVDVLDENRGINVNLDTHKKIHKQGIGAALVPGGVCNFNKMF